MEKRKTELEEHEAKKIEHNKKMLDIKQKIEQSEKGGAGDLTDLKEALNKLEKEGEEIKKRDEELKKKEKVRLLLPV